MGREVRKVTSDWKHPEDEDGNYIALLEGYSVDARDFMEKARRDGLQSAVDYFGQAPDMNDYMPEWPESEKTHFMMYETTSEGTPISPAFEAPEELSRWLADTGASAFGRDTASYEAWLRVANGGFAPSAVIRNGNLESGVEAMCDV